MDLSRFQRTVGLFAFGIMIILVASSCKKDECEDIICQPCPSSRLVINYQDSTGACPAAFDASARIHAISLTDLSDTIYSYDFSDSCKATFLVQENVEYHLVATSPAYSEVIRVEEFSYQMPDTVSECCFCYPVSQVTLNIGGDTTLVDFPVGAYENDPVIRVIN